VGQLEMDKGGRSLYFTSIMEDFPPGMTFAEKVRVYLADGWWVTSDGPTGIQFVGPKKMRFADRLCLILGVVGLVA
jgi:hypothetical protein